MKNATKVHYYKQITKLNSHKKTHNILSVFFTLLKNIPPRYSVTR